MKGQFPQRIVRVPHTKHLGTWLLIATSIAMMALCNSTLAGSATWRSAPSTGNWNTATNWSPATIPNGASDMATFRSSNKIAIGVSGNTQVNGVIFDSNASDYIITIESNFTLTISGTGINDTLAFERFVTRTDANHNPATILFSNNATANYAFFTNDGGQTNFKNSSNAGTATFTNKGSTAAGVMGGQTNLFDNAWAKGGQFSNEGGTVARAGGGKITFSDHSSAGFGHFTNKGATAGGEAAGGVISFEGSATAGDGQLDNFGGSVSDANSAITEFHGTSTASNSELRAFEGSNGGKPGAIVFYNDSLGGNAFIGLVSGELDISAHNAPGVSTWWLGGSGVVFLGANNLTVGANNGNSFGFDGILQDGGRNGGIGGSLTKTGTGTFNLTSANIYTGPTVVNSGKLLVSNSSGSATGPGLVTVKSNSVFGGTGRVGGPVVVESAASLRGGSGTNVGDSLFLSNNLTLNSGSSIQLALAPSGTHSSLSRLGGTWSFVNNQAFDFIDVGAGAQAGLYDNIITGLANDPGSEASWTFKNPFFVGTFTYDGAGNIDLSLTTVGGHIFVSNTNSNRISDYKTSGTEQNLNLVMGLSHPDGIAISEGKVFVANHDNGVISVYTPSGTLVNASLINGLSGPSSLAVAGGNVYVIDSNGTIGKYTSAGTTVNASLVNATVGAGFAVSGDFLFVADFEAGTISKYTTAGALVNASFITGLNNPIGIAISDGKLFVANGTLGQRDGIQGFNDGTVGEYNANTGATINAALISGLDAPAQVVVSKDYLFVLSEFGSTIGLYTTSGATANATLVDFLNGSFSMAVSQDLLQVTKAVSRKVHGSAGTFDINLPLTGEPGVECRSGPVAGSYTLVFTFSNIVESGSAAVTTGTGSVFGSPSFENDTMSVNLTGVSDIQKLVVTLSNVTDNLSNIMPDTTVTMNVLVGDTSASKTVNATDVSQTKIQSGQSVTGANFREDINVNGTINSTDVSLVKSHSGVGLPAIFRFSLTSHSPTVKADYECQRYALFSRTTSPGFLSSREPRKTG